jgi:hypothetical protein
MGLGYQVMVLVPGVHRSMAIEMAIERCTSSGTIVIAVVQ